MPNVKMPDGVVVAFPDTMPPEQIKALILKKFHASDTAISLLMTVLPPAITVFLGPIVSLKSDRFRSRRRGWVRAR